MIKRKVFSKQERFQIFERDNFTCQYCGRKPPEVQLEVDHIVPLAKDGTNDEINLITACRDCNRGKGIEKLAVTNDFFNMKPIKFFDIPQSAVKAQILFMKTESNNPHIPWSDFSLKLKLLIDPTQAKPEYFKKFNGQKIDVHSKNNDYEDNYYIDYLISDLFYMIGKNYHIDQDNLHSQITFQDIADTVAERFVGISSIHKKEENKYFASLNDLHPLGRGLELF